MLLTAFCAFAPPHEPYWFVSVAPPAAYRLTDPPRLIVLPDGTMLRDVGEADAPGALAAGIELGPLADIPALELAAGADDIPLAENWLGVAGDGVGVTVGRRAA